MAGKEYVVTATRLYTLEANELDDGKRTKRVRHFRGDVIGGLSEEDVERYTAAGAIVPKGDKEAAELAQATPAAPHPAETGDPGDPAAGPRKPVDPQASDIVAAQNSATPVAKPAKAATKEAWANYAVASGQMSADQAAKKTRDELRDTLK